MDITKIDKNFKIGEEIIEGGLKHYVMPHENFSLYGVHYDTARGKFYRMDSAVADTVNEGVKYLATFTSGGRIRFSTNSKRLEIAVTYDSLNIMTNMPLSGSAGFAIMEETEDGSNGMYKMLAPIYDQKSGYKLSVALPGEKMRNYILWFPLYNEVTKLVLSFEENAIIEKGKPYKDLLPILYYGSSITQGASASRADNCYPALISKWNNVDFINLGFSGNAFAEDAIVDYLATIKCSLFVCDYDHNAPDAEHLRKTHYRLYTRYREKNPNVPILFLTEPDDWFGYHTERYKIIKQTYLKAKKAGDKNVYFIDGFTLIGKVDRINCLVDRVHPNDIGQYRMAKKIYKKLISIDERFK